LPPLPVLRGRAGVGVRATRRRLVSERALQETPTLTLQRYNCLFEEA
jgi:hypothetical protein